MKDFIFPILVVIASAIIIGAPRASAQAPAPPPALRDVSCAATSTGFCCGEAGPAGPVLRCVNAAGEPMPWQNPFQTHP